MRKCEESETSASVDLKVAIDCIIIMFLSCRSSQQQGRDENMSSIAMTADLNGGPSNGNTTNPQSGFVEAVNTRRSV